MNKKSFTFWILLVASLLLSTLVISFTLKIMKAVLFLVLLVVLTPLIYAVLKNFLAAGKFSDRSDKMKMRD